MRFTKRGTLVLTLVVALFAAALAGCTTTVVSPAANTNPMANTVTAPGTGTYSAPPDQAVMTFGVSSQAKDAKPALDLVSARAAKITAAIKKAGVADKDIQTANVSIDPQYSDKPNTKPQIIGYQASISVRAKVRDLGSLSKVIDMATAAGVDNVDGPQFSIADDSPDRDKAIQLAVDDARRSASAMAKAAGKTLGGVISVSTEQVYSSGHNTTTFGSIGGRAAAVPIQPGQLDVVSNVTVVFEMK